MFLTQLAFSQDVDKCRNVVKEVFESINNRSPEKLYKYLSEDFTIAGQTKESAKMVLVNLFSQFDQNNISVKSYSELKRNKQINGIEFKYDVEYDKIGSKEATFFFNENNLLEEFSLFYMEVKTLDLEVKKGAEDVIKVPFKLMRHLIVVDVELNGKKRKFIFDNGAPSVVLNSKYDLKNNSSTKGESSNNSGKNYKKVRHLNFYDIQLKEQDVLTMDLSHLEQVKHGPRYDIYGIIGFEMMKDYDIIFDYENRILTLINPDIFNEYKTEFFSKNDMEIVPFEFEQHIPVIKAKIDRKDLNLGVDCGAEINIIDENLFDTLKNATLDVVTDNVIWIDNTSKIVNRGKIKKMNIGNKTLSKLSTLFSDISHLKNSYNLNIDGLIGYPLLSKQKTLISFQRKNLILIE